MQTSKIVILIIIATVIFCVIGFIILLANYYTLACTLRTRSGGARVKTCPQYKDLW